jgi:hypothetical protein
MILKINFTKWVHEEKCSIYKTKFNFFQNKKMKLKSVFLREQVNKRSARSVCCSIRRCCYGKPIQTKHVTKATCSVYTWTVWREGKVNIYKCYNDSLYCSVWSVWIGASWTSSDDPNLFEKERVCKEEANLRCGSAPLEHPWSWNRFANKRHSAQWLGPGRAFGLRRSLASRRKTNAYTVETKDCRHRNWESELESSAARK